MEINMCLFVCVWRTGQSFARNTWRNRDCLEELDIAEGVTLKWIVKKCGGLNLSCWEQWLLWELREQSNECKKFLD